MEGGELKFRGIEARRSDQAPFIQRFQKQLLATLAGAESLAACRRMREELAEQGPSSRSRDPPPRDSHGRVAPAAGDLQGRRRIQKTTP